MFNNQVVSTQQRKTKVLLYGLCTLVLVVFLMSAVKGNTFYNISTIAGTGTQGYSGDGGLATQAKLHYPSSVSSIGEVYIADTGNNVIRKILTNGTIT